jgi:hypothetical protein
MGERIVRNQVAPQRALKKSFSHTNNELLGGNWILQGRQWQLYMVLHLVTATTRRSRAPQKSFFGQEAKAKQGVSPPSPITSTSVLPTRFESDTSQGPSTQLSSQCSVLHPTLSDLLRRTKRCWICFFFQLSRWQYQKKCHKRDTRKPRSQSISDEKEMDRVPCAIGQISATPRESLFWLTYKQGQPQKILPEHVGRYRKEKRDYRVPIRVIFWHGPFNDRSFNARFLQWQNLQWQFPFND